MRANLTTLLTDFNARLADARAPLGAFAPLPAGMQDTEPLVFRFERALSDVCLIGDADMDRAALEDAAEGFGASLGIERRVWDGPAADAVEHVLSVALPVRRAA